MTQVVEWVIYFLDAWGYYFVFLLTFLETSMFVGLLVPGEMTVVLAGFLAASGSVEVGGEVFEITLQLRNVMWCAMLGAFLGDTVGYLIGRFGVGKLAIRLGRFFFVRERELNKVREYIERHGGKTIFFGRFTSFLRAFAPFVAGMMKMSFRRFLFYDFLGAVLWGATFSLLGYVFQESWKQAEQWVGRTILIALALAVVIVLIYRKRRKRKIGGMG